MSRKTWLAFSIALVVLSLSPVLCAQLPAPQDSSQPKTVSVPEAAAKLLRPLLDELQRYRSKSGNDEHQLDEQFRILVGRKDRFADEALVVLLCFDMGESQEEADAVIARRRKMLPYIKKYEDCSPIIPKSDYDDSMLKSPDRKSKAFQGVIKAIKNGWHSTADNPEG